jgi:hypothetical protein
VEKHRELPTSPVSVPIHATPSPTPAQVEEERREPAAEATNGDATELDTQADIRTDVVERGHGGVPEHGPPTPAKDAVAGNRPMVPVPASEGTVVS